MTDYLRQVVIVITPHDRDSTVSVVLRDTAGRSRVDRAAGTWRLPLGRVSISGTPLNEVLWRLGESLMEQYQTLPAEPVPAPPPGDMGGLSLVGATQPPLPLEL